jgi:hypothetical protein
MKLLRFNSQKAIVTLVKTQSSGEACWYFQKPAINFYTPTLQLTVTCGKCKPQSAQSSMVEENIILTFPSSNHA